MTTQKLTIGSWNMDSTSSISIAHSLSSTEWKTVNNIRVLILDDTETILISYEDVFTQDGGTITFPNYTTPPVTTVGGAGNNTLTPSTTGTLNMIYKNARYATTDSTNINIFRLPFFDNTSYDGIGFDRGFIIFDYIAD